MINSNVFSADNNLAASLSNQINKPAITKASYQHASSATTHVTTLTKPFSEILAEVEMLQKMQQQAEPSKVPELANTSEANNKASSTSQLMEKISEFGAKANQVVDNINAQRANLEHAASTAYDVANNVANLVNTAAPYVATAAKVSSGIIEVGSAVAGGFVAAGPAGAATAGLGSMVKVISNNYSTLFSNPANSANPVNHCTSLQSSQTSLKAI